MKKYLKYLWQSLAVIFITAGFLALSSCEEEEPLSDEIVLLSFGPSGVVHGEQIVFIGDNLDKVTSVALKPDITIERSEFIEATKESFKIVVPQAAEAGKVILNTPKGAIESKSMLSFKVDVVISSITPTVKPGNNITIKGTKINWIEKVTFASDQAVEKEDFVSQSQTELVVTAPLGAQTGFLIFATGGTKPLTFASEDELNVTIPAVTAISPASLKHEDNLKITGTDLDLIREIAFGGEVVVLKDDFVSQSATEIVVAVPSPATKGKVTLRQHSPIDVVTEDEITILLPVGTSVAPVPAIPGTDNITITGTNLDLVKSLKFPGVESQVAAFVSKTATEIVVAVPEGAKNGGIGYITIHDFTGNLGATLIVPSEGPPPLPITIFDDEAFFGGKDYSFGGTRDMASADQFYSGNVSFKFTYEGDNGGLAIGELSELDASKMDVLVFSLYGSPGTDGKNVAVILNDNWSNYNTVELVAEEWTEYRVELSKYPAIPLDAVNRVTFKIEGTAGGEILYADRIGFDTNNLIGNSSFESPATEENPLAANWLVLNGAADISISTDEFHSGSKSLRVNPDGGAEHEHQVAAAAIPLTFQGEYEIKLWAKAAEEGGKMRVSASRWDGEGADYFYGGDIEVTTDWVEYTWSFTVGKDLETHHIVLDMGAGAKTLFIDDVRLTEKK